MNPAFSVILFTSLSGAGYGLFFYVGLLCFFLPRELFSGDPAAAQSLFRLLLVPLATGIALTAIGLISSTFHLGKPLRAWRAFSQWRTSWLSREGVLSMLTYAPAVALFALFLGAPIGRLLPWLGAALALLSLATVACTAMIYASLKPVPAWRHGLVVPVYLVFALLTGLALLLALLPSAWAAKGVDAFFIVPRCDWSVPMGLALVLGAMKLTYWRGIDRIELPSREAATALEGIGRMAVFERPHTEANYLTREMGFVLARKHSRKLRAMALALFVGVPILAWLATLLLPSVALPALWIAAIAAIAGAFVERWLFFAEARHMVMLYY